MREREGIISTERIVLFEDGSEASQTLKADLRATGYDFVSVPSFETAVAVLRQDIVSVCAWATGGCDQKLLEDVERMRLAGVRWPIVILLARLEEAERVSLRKAGASDVLERSRPNEEIVVRSEALLNDAARLTKRTFCDGLIVMEWHGGWVHVAEKDGWVRFHLPPKQFDALEALAQRNGKVVPHASLRLRLWPTKADVPMKRLYETVDSARDSLEAATTKVRLNTVRDVGYSLCVVGEANGS